MHVKFEYQLANISFVIARRQVPKLPNHVVDASFLHLLDGR